MKIVVSIFCVLKWKKKKEKYITIIYLEFPSFVLFIFSYPMIDISLACLAQSNLHFL